MEILEGVILTLSGAFKSPGGLVKTQTAGTHPELDSVSVREG